jgi:hypothetical protein
MRPFILLCCAVAIVGCAKSDTPASDTATAATPTPPPPPPPLALSDVAGKWNVTGKSEGTDSTIVTYVLTTTADTKGWSIKFPTMARPVPVTVGAVEGDSVLITAGPFPSQTRKGMQVKMTNSTMRLRDGKLVGTTVAHYNTKTADSVRRITTEGTRAP